MIFVRRDIGIIPEKLLKVARRAQCDLEALPQADHKAFIKKKGYIWRAFARYLSQMSYGKCWYSESKEEQGFFDVDHFRPKAEAIRSETKVEPGYDWLAFSWENFRYSAQRSNRLSTHEETDETVGKGAWFPLLPNSKCATWSNRCEQDELPMLLDPTVKADVDLLDIDEYGLVCPTPLGQIGLNASRVEKSTTLYGLDLPKVVEARREVLRSIQSTYEILMRAGGMIDKHPDDGDYKLVDKITDQLRLATHPSSRYSKAARAKLQTLGLGVLCVQAEGG